MDLARAVPWSVADARSGGEYRWQQLIQGKTRHTGRRGTLRARVHGPTERGTRARIGHLGRRPSRYGSHCPETTGVSDAGRDSPPETGGTDG